MEMNQVRVLVVPAEEENALRLASMTASHDEFCVLVDDINTDTVFFADGSGMTKVAANSKAMGMPRNVRATQLMERVLPGYAARDHVAGDAVLAGLADNGEAADISEDLVALAERLYGTVATG